MSEEIHVALAFDEAYAVHGATAITSLVANAHAGERLCVHIVDTGLAHRTRQRLSALAEGTPHRAVLHVVRKEFFSGFPTDHHAASTYARLALPDLLPALDRVLYIDADVVVLDSVSQLWHTDLEGRPAAAAKDAMAIFGGTAVDYWRSIGLHANSTYFNAGVLLMNLELWRSQQTVKEVRSWIAEHNAVMKHSDQSALNAVLAERVKMVHLRWNLQTPLVPPVRFGWGSTLEMAEAVKNPAIIHFTTGEKPWKRKYRVPMARQYWSYRRQLSWASPAEPLTLPVVATRVAAEAQQLRRQLRTAARRLLGRIPTPS